MSDLLAIIPARAGSKGIPGKALRTVGGVPMILRTLRTVTESGVAERIVVSTDCPEIQSFCELRGYEVLRRPDALGADDVPLIDVAIHAVKALNWRGTVGLFQPTCPLLTPETVRHVVGWFSCVFFGWAITASADPHIHWINGKPTTERVQRQALPDIRRESGAIQLFRMEYADDLDEPFESVGTVLIDPREALDVDTPDDLLLAERLASLRRIHFVVLMGDRVGTGHFHRSKALAQALSHHNITWEWRGDPPAWAREQIPYPEITEVADLVIFDCLTPDKAEVLAHRAAGKHVVVLEDESGSTDADLTINDMLDPAALPYVVLRPEFLCLPEREQREIGMMQLSGGSFVRDDRVFITFGGTDPACLTDRCMRVLRRSTAFRPGTNFIMAKEMRYADLVLTGQGRTVFEAAACGTPCISIAANEREARHVRIPGVTYLGLHSTVTDDQIRQAVRSTLADVELRKENAAAAKAAIDGRGLDRLVRRIEDLICDRVETVREPASHGVVVLLPDLDGRYHLDVR